MQNDYEKAKHEGDHAYRRAILSGRYPYLPALNSMVQDIDKYPVRDLGIKERHQDCGKAEFICL